MDCGSYFTGPRGVSGVRPVAARTFLAGALYDFEWTSPDYGFLSAGAGADNIEMAWDRIRVDDALAGQIEFAGCALI